MPVRESILPLRTASLAFLLVLLLIAAAGAGAPPATAQTETVIACGDEEEPEPAVDENGILVDPDDSTEEERASDYDDSAEDQAIPEDEGDELTPEERAAMGACMDSTLEGAFAKAVRTLDRRWNGRKRLLLGTYGSQELPYGGTVAFTLKAGRAVLGRSRLSLRSGDSGKLRFRLTRKGRRALRRKGRMTVTATLALTDRLSGQRRAKRGRVVLMHGN